MNIANEVAKNASILGQLSAPRRENGAASAGDSDSPLVCKHNAESHFTQLMREILGQSEFSLQLDCAHSKQVLKFLHPEMGFSLLHFAILEENLKNLETLLAKFKGQHDIDLFSRGTFNPGVSALHLAAQGNYPGGIQLLLDHNAAIDLPDAKGLTPLQHAAKFKNTEAAACLIERGATLNTMLPHKIHPNLTTLALVLRKTPNAESAIQMRLDESISVEFDEKANNKKVIFDISSWLIEHESTNGLDLLHVFAKEGKTYEDEPDANHSELIEHPLVQKMMRASWTTEASLMYYSIVIFKLLFVIVIIAYVVIEEHETWLKSCLLAMAVLDLARKCISIGSLAFGPTAASWRRTILNYVLSFHNYYQIVCIVGAFVLFFTRDVKLKQMFGPLLFLAAWLDLMVIVGDHKIFGLYLDMYYSVLLQFFKILVSFSIFLVGFMICFWMYFKDDKNFSLLYLAVTKFFVMFIGEIDYNALIDNYMKNQNLTTEDKPIDFHTPGTSYLIFPLTCVGLFVVAVPIVLQSLLVGQVVNDIAQINKRAKALQLKRQANQLEYVQTSCDSIRYALQLVISKCKKEQEQKQPIKQNYVVLYCPDDDSLPDYVHDAFRIGIRPRSSNLQTK